jgi:hypothetical protein
VVFEEPLAFDYYFRLIDPDTPLFTVGGDHIGHTLAIDATPDSPEFLGRRASFISAISAERLLAYLRQSLPPRLWLVVFQHEAGDQTVGTDIAQPLVQTGYYEVVSRVGYAPQDPIYSQIRARLRGRTSITYKAEIVLYIRTRDQDQTPAHTLGKD